MALFESGNPTLSQKIFDRSRTLQAQQQGVMSVRGTMNKFGFLLLMIFASAAYAWRLYQTGNPGLMNTLMMVGIFGGFILAFIISFKPNLSSYLAPLYALLEGFFIGGISVIVNNVVSEKNPAYGNIVLSAVGLTFGVAFAVFILYNLRIIKATQKFKSIIISATLGIGIFYLITIVLGFFHVNLPFMYDSSMLGIGINLVIVAIAALNLVLDFDMIEQGAEQGAPKFMEWYGAFALMVTIVWLYIEILKLLLRFAGRRN
jgi:Predicted membrane protein